MQQHKYIFKIIFFHLLGFVGMVNAQQIEIKGTLQDSLQQPVAFATIIASSDSNENKVLAYTTSNDTGNFLLKIKNPTDSLWITIRHLEHARKQLLLKAGSQNINVVLSKQENQLKEVQLKARKTIEVSGDTITYNVDGLKKEKDYTIEEVIARIPGVEISDSGQIKYKDKPISHLYLNGVDLLEGRYNIATRGIPADAVEDIDIMKRHNHARIDKGRTESDDVAFNLKIKKDRSLVFGSTKADAGVPFFTGLVEATPIYIQDNFQDIASVKANNLGKSLASNGTSLTQGNQNLATLQLQQPSILVEPNTNGSSISNEYWLDNESLSLTNDALVKAGDDLIFKVGTTYNNGKNAIERNSNQTFFFGNDSTVVDRQTRNNIEEELFYLGLVQEINKDKLYFNNRIKLSTENNNGLSSNIQNGAPLDYTYESRVNSIADLLEFKTTIGEPVLNNGLLIEYMEVRERSRTVPGVFEDQIPSDFNPEQTDQNVITQQFNIGGYTAFNFKLGKTKWEAKQSLDWKSEQLQSDLQQRSGNQVSNLGFPFNSDFELRTLDSNTSLKSIYSWGKYKVTLTPQLTYLNIDKKELFQSDLDQQEDYVFFQPRVSINYKYNYQWSFLLSGTQTANTSRFPQLYNGLILQDFSGLNRNPDAINVTRNTAANFFINYDNILSGFFFNNATSITDSTSDFTFSSNIDANGLLQVEAIERENQATSISNRTSFTKRFFRILRTELRYSVNYRKGEQFFNTQVQEFENTNHGVNLELGLDNNTWYGISYNGILNYGISRVNDLRNTNLFLKHQLELDFYTSSKSRLNFSVESVSSSTSTNNVVNRNTLSNISYFYKPNKKLFLRASLNNIFAEDFFTTVQNSANFISQSQFSLRPRQFTIGLNYSL